MASRIVGDMPTWPLRPTVCLHCRTLQPATTACVAGAGHQVVDLHAAPGRAALLQRVWGSPSVRARIRTAAKVGGTGGATGGLDACSGCDLIGGGGSLGEIIAVIALVAIVFVAVYLLVLGVRALWRWWRRPSTVRPNGAAASGVTIGRSAGRCGVVVARTAAPAAIGDAPCVGFALEAVARDRGQRVVLRDGATVGFDVQLDDGGLVTVAPGPLAIDLDGAPARAVAPTYGAYLDQVDPHRRTAQDLDPFPATHVRQRLVRAGDRVEVRGALRPLPGAATGPAYRGVTSERWIPIGVPRIVTEP